MVSRVLYSKQEVWFRALISDLYTSRGFHFLFILSVGAISRKPSRLSIS